jgi:hypothetical protein
MPCQALEVAHPQPHFACFSPQATSQNLITEAETAAGDADYVFDFVKSDFTILLEALDWKALFDRCVSRNSSFVPCVKGFLHGGKTPMLLSDTIHSFSFSH